MLNKYLGNGLYFYYDFLSLTVHLSNVFMVVYIELHKFS